MTTEDEANKYRDYWATVASIASEAKEAEARGEDAEQFMHESVDGSHYVIYTYANLEALQHGRNESAAFDEAGDDALAGCKSYGEVMARLAFYAMLADVREEFASLPDAEEPEEEEATPADA